MTTTDGPQPGTESATVLVRLTAPGEPVASPAPADAAIADLTRDILISSASAVDDWCDTSARWLHSPAADSYRERLRSQLMQRCDGQQLVVLSFPAVAPLLPLVQQVLDGIGAAPVYLIAIADPEHATGATGADEPAWRSRLLWLRHLLNSEHATRAHTRIFRYHPQAAADWRAVIEQAVERFAIAADAPTRARAGTGFEALPPEPPPAGPARGVTGRRPSGSNAIPALIDAWVESAEQAAAQLADPSTQSAATTTLDGLRDALDESCNGLGQLLQQADRERTRLRRSDEQQRSALDRLTRDLDDAEARIDDLAQIDQTTREQQAASLLRLNAIQTSVAWNSAKPVHWLEFRRPDLMRRIARLAPMLIATLRGRGTAYRRQLAKQEAVRDSGLFDSDYYVTHNPDVINAGTEPLWHWMHSGWRDGRKPHPLFDTPWYLQQHPELETGSTGDTGDTDPLTHYLANCMDPGGNHDPSPLFDTRYYLEELRDTPHCEPAGRALPPLVHYLRHGSARDLSPHPLFDRNWYLAQSPDASAPGVDPLVHYLEHGAAAERDPCPLFNSSWYLQRYPDVAAAGLNPLVHFIRTGADEHRDPGPLFDTGWYVSEHPEAAADGRNPLAYYLSTGTGLDQFPNPAATTPPDIESASATARLDDSYALSRTLPPWDGDWERLVPIPDQSARTILVVDAKHPTPDLDSGSYRMLKILECLVDLGHPVVFVGDQPAEDTRYVDAVESLGITCLTGRKAALRHLMSAGAGVAHAILSRPEVCERYLPLVRAFAPSASVLYDTVDLHWVRLERGARVSDDPAPLLRAADRYQRLELANARASDITIAITDDEKDTLLEQAPELTVGIIPNIHDLADQVPPFETRSGLFFIGSFGHAPNVEAVHFLVEQIMPRVAAEIPDIRLHIVGSLMPDDIAALASEHINPIGYVEDVTPYFRDCRVFVAPLLHGAGMKGKVGQSLSFGLPVVTTGIGAEGIGLSDGVSALISDEPEPLARSVIRAYTDIDLWRQLSGAGLEIISKHFTTGAVRHELQRLTSTRAANPSHTSS